MSIKTTLLKGALSHLQAAVEALVEVGEDLWAYEIQLLASIMDQIEEVMDELRAGLDDTGD